MLLSKCVTMYDKCSTLLAFSVLVLARQDGIFTFDLVFVSK